MNIREKQLNTDASHTQTLGCDMQMCGGRMDRGRVGGKCVGCAPTSWWCDGVLVVAAIRLAHQQ